MKPYPSSAYFSELKRALEPYYPNYLDDKLKLKRRKAIEQAYQGNPAETSIYQLQHKLRRMIKNIEMSQLIGCNDVIVDVITEEYRVLNDFTKQLRTKVATLKRFGELLSVMKPLTKLLNKDLEAMLIKDLNHLTHYVLSKKG